MTEYDYSPDAIERQHAKLASIANWVDKTKQHEPTNPFVPLPGEHPRHSDFYPQSPPDTPPPQVQQQTYGYPYSYQYQYPYQTMPHYPQQQMYYPSQPQPAFYATPQGVISPTYSSMYVSPASKSHRSRRSSSHHSSGSRSLHPSSTSMSIPLQPMVLGSRSYSSPPSQTGHYFISPTTSPNGGPYMMQVGQQQQLAQPVGFAQQPVYPLPPGYTTMHSNGSTPAGSPYSSYYSLSSQPISTGTSRGRSKSRSRSESYSHSHTSSHRSGRSKPRSGSYSNLHQVQVAQPQPLSQVQPSQNPYGMASAYGAHSTAYLQPTTDQPVVVPLNGGGYVIVPAAGQGVSVAQPPPPPYEYPHHNSRSDDSDSDSERGAGGSFFGSLSLGRRKKKSRRHSRTGSY